MRFKQLKPPNNLGLDFNIFKISLLDILDYCYLNIDIIFSKNSHLDGLGDGDPLSVHSEEGRVLSRRKRLNLKSTKDHKLNLKNTEKKKKIKFEKY